MDEKTHVLRYSDVTNKRHRLRVRIMNSGQETCTVIAGRPGQEYIIGNVPKGNLREIARKEQHS